MADDIYTVERSVTVDAPPARIYAQIVDFRNWRNWSPWEGLDPQLRRTYSGAEAGTGAVYGWSGNRKAGKGRMAITDTTEPSSVRVDVVFEKPWKTHTDTTFTITAQGAQTRLTWSMTGRNTLMTRAMSIIKSMDGLLGPDFEKGLAELKATAEGPSAG